MMTEIIAQGDLLLARVRDVAPPGSIAENAEGAAFCRPSISDRRA
jgi:hypothetical protein